MALGSSQHLGKFGFFRRKTPLQFLFINGALISKGSNELERRVTLEMSLKMFWELK
jgi:hypothetical protein